jgi:alpha-L-fucosidase
VLQENIANGQKIKSFQVQAWQNNRWENIDFLDGHWDSSKGYSSSDNDWQTKEMQTFTTIGYKRILKINTAINTNKIRVQILDSKNNPQISNIEVY